MWNYPLLPAGVQVHGWVGPTQREVAAATSIVDDAYQTAVTHTTGSRSPTLTYFWGAPGVPPAFTDGDHNAPLESVAAMWDDAVEPYEESSVYPTLWQWLDQFEIGSPVLFDDFVSEIAAMTSPAACSQNKCYLSSKRARGKGAPIRAYTVREALEQIWDDDSHGIWLTPYMAVASSNGAPVEYLDHKLGVRTIGSKEWLEPLNNGVELET